MKKLLLLVVSISIAFGGMAQKGAQISQENYKKSVKAVYTTGVDEIVNVTNAPNSTVASKFEIVENQIGTTKYDLQSNSVHGERGYMTADGEKAFVWTMGLQDSDFPDRGTGYNYFDGSAWGPEPTERQEDARSGWPSIAMYGDGEVITAHGIYEGSYTDLGIMTRPTRGSGDWNLVGKPGTLEGVEYVWNRLATSGANNDIIHLISNSYNEYNGQANAITYSRTSDGGTTWEANDVILDGTGPDYYTGFSADDYKIIAKGDVVCIFYVSPWHDLFYMRSDDNGENWTKEMVWEHPYPLFDWDNTITTDTIWGPDGSFDAAIDNNGQVHMVFPLTRVIHTEAGTSYNYFPWTDAVVYWNDGMDQFVNEENQHYALNYDNLTDEQYIGWTPDMDDNGTLDLTDDLFVYRTLGMSTMPTLTIDDDNNIFVAWSSANELLTASGETPYNYHHLFGRAKAPFWTQGGTANGFLHITEGFLHNWHEVVYPYMLGAKDEKVYMIANMDATPGLALDEDHEYIDNFLQEFIIDYSEFGSDIAVENTVAINSVSQNFPNPASDLTTVEINVSNASEATIEVVNMVGQSVMVLNESLSTGSNEVQINVSDLSTGIYFYTVSVGSVKETKKMIVK